MLQKKNKTRINQTDDHEIQFKQSFRKSKSITNIKRSVSRDKENCKSKNNIKLASETFKLRDILKNKDQTSNHITTKSSPQRSELYSNSRMSNCNCNKEIFEDNFQLKQEIMDYLQQIQDIVQKNQKYMTTRSNETNTDKTINQGYDYQLIEEQDVNLNQVIEQQQFQIQNFKMKLQNQESQFNKKEQAYQTEIFQLKSQVIQLQSEMTKLQEQIHQEKFQARVREYSINKKQ